ncbi:MAG TPA: ribose-5-phosphate isomerase RpiA [Phycisphaerae bacterium]|nr:ribose-5-phosphate isomerase RpiA [Phycisphaerae bacterium]
MPTTDSKTTAARHALQFVKPGMIVGLGSGSTAAAFVTLLGAEAALREAISAVCTSGATQRLAESLGFKLRDVNDVVRVDLTVDGADEITTGLDMIKGGGGALFRERIVARLSDFHVTIAHAAKLVPALGGFPLPVEIVPFAQSVTMRWILDALAVADLPVERWTMRTDKNTGAPFRTDNGNAIADVKLAAIRDPALVAALLDRIDGVVTHGLFLGLTHLAVVAEADGAVRELRR